MPTAAVAPDPLERLARSFLDRRGRPLSRPPEAVAAARWSGVPVEYRRRADGTVVASCLGLTGAGPTETAALLALDRWFRT